MDLCFTPSSPTAITSPLTNIPEDSLETELDLSTITNMPPGWNRNKPIPGVRTIDTSFNPELEENQRVSFHHLNKVEKYLHTQVERKLASTAPKSCSFHEFEKKVSVLFFTSTELHLMYLFC